MKHTTLFRVFVWMLAIMLALGCVNALAASITQKEALKIAKKALPVKAKLVETEWDQKDREWEFEFLTENQKTEYEITVSKDTGKVTEIEMEKKNVRKAQQYSVKRSEAKKAVLAAFPGARNLKAEKVTDNGSRIFRITFVTEAFRGKAKVHGESGKIIAWEKNY